jgi:hypothetical protein
VSAGDQLRALAQKATPGPWAAWQDELYWKVDGAEERGNADGPNVCNTGRTSWPQTGENARLIALAPQLAELAADMADALEEATGGWTLPGDLEHDYEELLQRFRALTSQEPDAATD